MVSANHAPSKRLQLAIYKRSQGVEQETTIQLVIRAGIDHQISRPATKQLGNAASSVYPKQQYNVTSMSTSCLDTARLASLTRS